MASNIGCSSGRAKLVDPNNFSGQGSSDNIFVPLEDLNISVILKSFRKGRTLLTAESDGTGVTDNVAQIQVNFIEGSSLGGKKVLTTKYTDLTTVFDTDVVNDETLGISSIDIEFNASMAPMVTINFIDVRGSSIFQNEEKILGNKGNKYTTFFQLPYPMFELEIKGFYGLPVKYCLHMWKFNSKFNSQTGNFEITANFIGYTFALMSDMLLGYLRAIPYTTIGAERLTAYREETGEDILTLDVLADKINRINEGLKKEAGSSQESADYNAARDAIGYIDTIKGRIKTLGGNLDLNKGKSLYDFIIMKHADKLTSDQETALNNTYKENVIKDIEAYNKLVSDTDKLVEKDFTEISNTTNTNGGKLYKNITKKSLSDNSDADLAIKLGNPSDLAALKKKILEEINKNYKDTNAIADDALLDIYDMTLLNDKLGKTKVTLEKDEEESKKALAENFAVLVRDEFGFEPTIRPLVECFTAAIEIFVESIFSISQAASTNADRTAELAKKFSSSDLNTSDMHGQEIDKQQFYPWPDYREKDETKGGAYVEKYLGAAGVLENPDRVNELVFIDELLEAFRKSYKAQQETVEQSNQEETTWFPVNIFDSFLFSDSEPYSRYEILTLNDAVRIMVIRAMTFLGYSYNPALLNEQEIAALAQIEVDSVLRGIEDDTIKQQLTSLTLDTVKKVQGTINDIERVVTNVSGTKVSYDYMFINPTDKKPISWKLLPVNKGFNKEGWNPNEASLIKKRDNDGFIFFTNYSSNLAKDGNGDPVYKRDDGGTYIKILDSLTEAKTLLTPPEGITTESVIDFKKIKEGTVDKSAGFNPFGGAYGVQEFKNMDWGEPSLQGLPLMYVFYKDRNTGLALTREASKDAQKLKYATTSEHFLKTGDKVNTAIPIVNEDKENAYLGKEGDETKMHFNLGKNRLLFNSLINGGEAQITYPYIELTYDANGVPGFFSVDEIEPYSKNSFSLFGSDLYYGQVKYAKITKLNNTTVKCTEAAKAFLFLNALPFNFKWDTGSPFGQNEIINLFKNSSGIIHAPRLWCAYIGGTIWRNSYRDPIIENGVIVGGGSGKGDPIWWDNRAGFYGDFTLHLDKDEYFPPVLDMYWGSVSVSYPDADSTDLINRLPIQIKDEFIRIFFEFVNGTGKGTKWRDLADKLEIFDNSAPNSYDAFLEYIDAVRGQVGLFNRKVNGNTILNFSNNGFSAKKDNIDKYYDIVIPVDAERIFGTVKDPLTADPHDFYLFLELRDGTSAVKSLLKAITEEVFIINSGYKVWGPNNGTEAREPIEVESALFDAYFNSVIEKLKGKADEYNPVKQNEAIDLKIFGTANKDIIRLQLYKTCKNIYDKWLGGAKSIDKLVFQCGGRSLIDTELAKKYRGKPDAKPRMIDSFRFVARSFRDIGDLLYVNPIPINETLIGNINTSAYDMIASLLAANEFQFQPLPNFINYRDDKILKSIFQPFNYSQDEIPEGACGPSFVCVYIGQGSKHLDYGKPERSGNNASYYPNDGFDLRCKDGGLAPDAPDDIIGGGTLSESDPLQTDNNATNTTNSGPEAWEEPVSSFVVKYSQQNQNIFKDIQLDQSEFSETDESLQIQDEISQKGSGNNRAIAGQNIYNVYAVRSYSAKVEMMGNAMIQPMMFFQLDNIPMFHGAYMITKVSHSIKPNSMSTNFTGTRIRYPETPLVTAYDVYMDILQTLDTTEAGTGTAGGSGGGGGGVSGKFAPIIVTIIDNGGLNGRIEAGKITVGALPKITGVDNGKLNNKEENKLITEAIEPFKKMMGDWITWMKAEGFKGNGGNYVGITSIFRDYEKQVKIKEQYGSAAATPGSSNHGWGIALDLQFYNKSGGIIPNTKNTSKYFKFDANPAIKWLYDNSYKYGWVFPASLRDGSGLEEHWHIEYHGTSAKCIIENSPTIYGYTVNVDKNAKIDASVKNPKTKDGKEAVYSNCDFITVKKEGDGNDSGSGGKAAFGCKSPNYSFEFTNPLPPADKLPISEAIKILKKLPSNIGKAVFAVLWAEAGKTKDRTAFSSAGGHNYAGVQTDGGKWGAPGIIGQYCRVDSGGNKRAFAMFESDETFLKFMADRIEKKGFDGNNGDSWTQTYIQSWWSPAAKASYTKGTTKYNEKLAIYNTAMKKWNAG